MIDYLLVEAAVNVAAPCVFGQIEPFIWKGINFIPKYSKELFVIGYAGVYNGLRVTLLPCKKIRIENSLHKFYKHNNYSDFSSSEICKAVNIVCSKFSIAAEFWEIKKLELGFNIQTPQAASSYIPLFHSYKGVFFNKVMYGNKLHEMKCFLTEYAIKVYDKTEQLKRQEKLNIEKDILRIEICYNKKRKLPKEIETLADLKNSNKIKLLYEDFESMIKKIVFYEGYNLTGASFEDRCLLLASLNSDFWKVNKDLNKRKTKAYKEKLKVLREKYFKKELKQFLLKLLKDKYISLFCS